MIMTFFYGDSMNIQSRHANGQAFSVESSTVEPLLAGSMVLCVNNHEMGWTN